MVIFGVKINRGKAIMATKKVHTTQQNRPNTNRQSTHSTKPKKHATQQLTDIKTLQLSTAIQSILDAPLSTCLANKTSEQNKTLQVHNNKRNPNAKAIQTIARKNKQPAYKNKAIMSGSTMPTQLALNPLLDNTVETKSTSTTNYGHRQRVREKVFNGGTDGLLDYELLEIFLFNSYKQMDTKALAKQLLHKFGSLAGIFSSSKAELLQIKGIGQTTVTHCLAVGELILRILKSKIKTKPVLDNWQEVLDYLMVKFSHKHVELFSVLFLDPGYHLLADKVMATGTVDKTPVYPREIAKEALALGATSVILVHNHPSSAVKPSEADLSLTKQIVVALSSLHIRVDDHVIVGGNKAFSFSNQGLL